MSSLTAHAAEPSAGLVGGEAVEPCAWPTTLRGSFGAIFGVRCGGVLIHPEVVAVHTECAAAPGFEGVTFSDGADGPEQTVDGFTALTEDSCIVQPGASVAFCRLAEPVDLPITPIVYGCELGIAGANTTVAQVGFGYDQPPPDGMETGQKYWGLNHITTFGDDTFLVSEQGPIPCGNSDLGSPVYVEYPDGSWHVLGISMESADCSETTAYRRLDPYVPWVESSFGIDITPCHDVDGNWAPSEACTELSLAGPVGGGSWESWCAETPTLAVSETCGPGFEVPPADPVVIIDAPADQTQIPASEAVTIAISVNHPIVDVQLEIDGMLQPAVDDTWPYAFAGVQFPVGTYSVVAVAEGEDGIARESAPIEIHVTGDEPGDGDGDGDGDLDDESGESGGQAEAEGGVAEESCACRADTHAPAGLAWTTLGLLALVRIRRQPRG
ncbi:MAG TPA: MYXO-CTERM sorting domain-containing protein [Enhygromyxa sp.]|nr:MYXO-CTERM sorting domain-containing protein [Enhygromyxa sp.]